MVRIEQLDLISCQSQIKLTESSAAPEEPCQTKVVLTSRPFQVLMTCRQDSFDRRPPFTYPATS
jgi:hypothetical protein